MTLTFRNEFISILTVERDPVDGRLEHEGVESVGRALLYVLQPVVAHRARTAAQRLAFTLAT